MLTRSTTIFKTKPVSFMLAGSPLGRMGLEARLLVEVLRRAGMMRTILTTGDAGDLYEVRAMM